MVGIHIPAARALVRAMEEARTSVSDEFRSRLKQALRVAEDDATPAAHASPRLFERYLVFLDHYAGDLRWRIETITRAPSVTLYGETSARLPFDSRSDARSAGDKDGRLFRKFLEEGTPEITLGDKLHDPEYAAAFLKAVGKERLAALLNQHANDIAYGKGLNGFDDAQLARFQRELGPLLDGIGSADSSGLVPDLSAYFLDNCRLDVRSALVASTRTSHAFLARTTSDVIDVMSRNGEHTWLQLRLMDGLALNPDGFLRLLAEDKGAAEKLFSEKVLKDRMIRKRLAECLDKALQAPDPWSLKRAWGTLVTIGAQDHVQRFLARDHELAGALVHGFLPAVESAGYLQALASVPGLDAHRPDELLLPEDLDPKLIQDFLGAAMFHPDLAKRLGEVANGALAGGDVGPATTRGGDWPDCLAVEAGVLAVFMGAIKSADADEETIKQAIQGRREFFVGLGRQGADKLVGLAGKRAGPLGDYLGGKVLDYAQGKIVWALPDHLNADLAVAGLREGLSEWLVAQLEARGIPHKPDKRLQGDNQVYLEDLLADAQLLFDALNGITSETQRTK